jgi:hypothetical protein
VTEYIVRVRKVGAEHRATVRQVSGVTEYKPAPGTFQTSGIAATVPAAILQAFAEQAIPEILADDRKRAA